MPGLSKNQSYSS